MIKVLKTTPITVRILIELLFTNADNLVNITFITCVNISDAIGRNSKTQFKVSTGSPSSKHTVI